MRVPDNMLNDPVGICSSDGEYSPNCGGGAPPSGGDNPLQEWYGQSKTGEFSDENFDNRNVVSQGTSLVWYGATEAIRGEGYLHDFALATTQQATNGNGQREKRAIGDTQWEIKTTNDGDNWVVKPQISKDYSGVGPDNSGDIVPDWFELPMDLALGMIHPAVAVAVSLDDLHELTKVTDDLDETDRGWEMMHKSGWFGAWTKASHVQRFLVKTPKELNSDGPHLEVLIKATENWEGLKTAVRYDISFGDLGTVDGPPSLSSQENLTSGETLDIETMERSDAFTTTKIDSSSLPSALQEKVQEVDESNKIAQSTQEKVTYITDWPMSIDTESM